MEKPRSGTSYRLSKTAQDLLTRLARRLGLTKTGIIEMAVRKLAYTEFGEGASLSGDEDVLGERPVNSAAQQHPR